jgi:hypothetical protein
LTPQLARAQGREAGRSGHSDRVPFQQLEAMSDEALFEWHVGHAEGAAVAAETQEAA